VEAASGDGTFEETLETFFFLDHVKSVHETFVLELLLYF